MGNMILPLTTLIVLFLHAIGYCSAFSGVPCRSLQYGVKRAGPSHRFVKQPTFAQHTVFTTLPLSAATSDNREPLETNQTVSSNFTTSDTLTAEGNSIGTSETKKGLFARFRGEKFDKASLAKLGGSVLLSYGFVSNVFGITCVSCAWYIASKKVRSCTVNLFGGNDDCISFLFSTDNRRVYLPWHLDSGKVLLQYMLPFLHF